MAISSPISWEIKSFEGLTNKELYNILRLRAEVFVVEQNCPYLDLDGKDAYSFHLMGINEKNKLIAYARLLPADISFKEVSIGRVVTSPAARRTGAGVNLMQNAIQAIAEKFGKVPVRIGAQLYLKEFYERFGFVQDSAMYLEDGIEHIEMLKKA
ncbi:MAG TPA: GNAT family N-acetyltransferase [Bacteroidia bacterium]|jgi:ElaA protein|nr:GNAT family N-acetyltransferase [Bacteroidia bacterium]